MTKKPNILFILIDDLGCRDLGCYGSTFYETPVLDQLAREGLLFMRAYASCPVCSPTRASIISGKYPARVGVTQFIGGSSEGKLQDVPYLHYLPLEEQSIAKVLKSGGYQTWHVGKWHLGDEAFHPENHGFEVNIGGSHYGHPINGFFSPWGLPNLDDQPEDTYLTDYLTDRAIELIEKRDPERPFFLNLSHYAVHTPIEAPDHLVEKYRKKAKRLKLDAVNPFVEGDYFPCSHKSDERITRRILQSDPVYAAMVENLDTNIGRVLETLKQAGLEKDTLVCFTSDNGGLATAEGSPTCNAPLAEGKGWNEEGGTRVCQIVKWPGRIQPGSVSHESVTSTDFYPTFLEAAELPLMPEQHMDGISLCPIWEEHAQLDRDHLFWHYPHYSNQGSTPAASVVARDWKLIHWFEDERSALYNLAEDISESTDLSAAMPGKVRELEATLFTWQKEIEAVIPQPNPEYPKNMKRPKVPNNAWD